MSDATKKLKTVTFVIGEKCKLCNWVKMCEVCHWWQMWNIKIGRNSKFIDWKESQRKILKYKTKQPIITQSSKIKYY